MTEEAAPAEEVVAEVDGAAEEVADAAEEAVAEAEAEEAVTAEAAPAEEVVAEVEGAAEEVADAAEEEVAEAEEAVMEETAPVEEVVEEVEGAAEEVADAAEEEVAEAEEAVTAEAAPAEEVADAAEEAVAEADEAVMEETAPAEEVVAEVEGAVEEVADAAEEAVAEAEEAVAEDTAPAEEVVAEVEGGVEEVADAAEEAVAEADEAVTAEAVPAEEVVNETGSGGSTLVEPPKKLRGLARASGELDQAVSAQDDQRENPGEYVVKMMLNEEVKSMATNAQNVQKAQDQISELGAGIAEFFGNAAKEIDNLIGSKQQFKLDSTSDHNIPLVPNEAHVSFAANQKPRGTTEIGDFTLPNLWRATDIQTSGLIGNRETGTLGGDFGFGVGEDGMLSFGVSSIASPAGLSKITQKPAANPNNVI